MSLFAETQRPFVIQYVYVPKKNDVGYEITTRSYDHYATALSQYKTMISRPDMYENVQTNFIYDEEEIADAEENGTGFLKEDC